MTLFQLENYLIEVEKTIRDNQTIENEYRELIAGYIHKAYVIVHVTRLLTDKN
jgi:hypothetical protein